MSLDEQALPPFNEQSHPAAPAPQPGTSGLAVAGLIFAFLVAPLGFILSLIAVFKTGAGRRKGRGLAITGLIVSVLIIAGGATVAAVVLNSTVADPGCVAGKSAILDNSTTVNAKSLQATVDGLKAAVAKAKHDNVRSATSALADDYTQLLKATKTGNVPTGLEDKITKDGDTFDSLCSIGS
jgi:hypothetical protein